jgi:hypothetical protein
MITLPAVPQLIQRTKALAALDLILSPEWDYRYYSFNARWSPDEQMASMRNGSGDEWWIVFHKAGWAALKGLDHESSAWSKGRGRLSAALNAVIPQELSAFSQEPAFRWSETSFAYFCLSDASGWKRANDLTNIAADDDTGEGALLRHLIGSAEDYSSFAEDYYEKSVPIEIVTAVFALLPITDSVIMALNSEIVLDDISSELFDEIAYPPSRPL